MVQPSRNTVPITDANHLLSFGNLSLVTIALPAVLCGQMVMDAFCGYDGALCPGVWGDGLFILHICGAGKANNLRSSVSTRKLVYQLAWHALRAASDLGIYVSILLHFSRQSDGTALRLTRVTKLRV